MIDAAATLPEGRYGHSRLSRTARHRVVIALVVVTVAVATFIAVLGYQRVSNSAVKGALAGYRLIDDETVAVTISVTRSDPSRPVDCIVRVRSKDGTETGRREVLVGPSQQETIQVTTTLKSSKPPAMGDIYGCGTDVPDYLRAP